MDLKFAFLALNAGQTNDGQLWCAGVDFDRIDAVAFPIPIQFHVVVKLIATPADRERDHVCRLDVTAPNGERAVLLEDHPINLGQPVNQNRDTYATLLVRVGRTFSLPGEYVFTVTVDDREVGMIRLCLDRVDHQ